MHSEVENINKDILRQCREQIGLELFEVEKKIKKIQEMEEGKEKPTYKQLDMLGELYRVPRWVFISDKLPEKYSLEVAIPAFRSFASSNREVFSNTKVRGLTARVERFRELIIELREDLQEPLPPLEAPKIEKNYLPERVAEIVKEWINPKGERLDFTEWRKIIENKGVFIFMTSKYKDWSYIEKSLIRGLTIYHEILPIIVINDSDARKAQTFTLIHELGHLIRKESTIDDWATNQKDVEKWCDEMAGNVLMPKNEMEKGVQKITDLDTVKKVAKDFKVSAYACLVRLKQLNIIDQPTYDKFQTQLKDEYEKIQKKLKESEGGPSRNRPQEVIKQYGRFYVSTLYQAYHNKEIGLHKLTSLFGLKRSSHVLEMETQL